MKLIGATDYLVRAPFVVEGMVIGMIGAAIPLILLYFMYQKIIVYIAEKFNFIGAMINFVSVHTVFKTLVPVAIILGAGIGFSVPVCVYDAARKFLLCGDRTGISLRYDSVERNKVGHEDHRSNRCLRRCDHETRNRVELF